MQSYVVHIHRRPDDTGGKAFVGVVERVDSAVTRPFTSLTELLTLLDIAAAAALPPHQRRN